MIERLTADLRSVNVLYPETHPIEKRRVIKAIQECRDALKLCID